MGPEITAPSQSAYERQRADDNSYEDTAADLEANDSTDIISGQKRDTASGQEYALCHS
jgi:hypothetical protein